MAITREMAVAFDSALANQLAIQKSEVVVLYFGIWQVRYYRYRCEFPGSRRPLSMERLAMVRPGDHRATYKMGISDIDFECE